MEILPRFKINKCNLVSQWGWDTINECCPICRNSVNEESIITEGSQNNSSHVVIGMCGHAFHYECINKWVKTSSNVCPLCNDAWEYQKKLEKKDEDEEKIDFTSTILENIFNTNEVTTEGLTYIIPENTILPEVVESASEVSTADNIIESDNDESHDDMPELVDESDDDMPELIDESAIIDNNIVPETENELLSSLNPLNIIDTFISFIGENNPPTFSESDDEIENVD